MLPRVLICRRPPWRGRCFWYIGRIPGEHVGEKGPDRLGVMTSKPYIEAHDQRP